MNNHKPIQLPKQTIEAMLLGGSSFVIPIEMSESKLHNLVYSLGSEISPLQSQEEFFVQEDFIIVDEKLYYKNDNGDPRKRSPISMGMYSGIASEMTYEQSRIKGIITNVQVKRIQDLGYLDTYMELFKPQVKASDYEHIPLDEVRKDFATWHNEQHGENAYEDNGYVFLYDYERKGD